MAVPMGAEGDLLPSLRIARLLAAARAHFECRVRPASYLARPPPYPRARWPHGLNAQPRVMAEMPRPSTAQRVPRAKAHAHTLYGMLDRVGEIGLNWVRPRLVHGA